MAEATAEVKLRLSDYCPRSELNDENYQIGRPRFPVIDYHNHLDGLDPMEVLRIMDTCDVEKIVNFTMEIGQAASSQSIASTGLRLSGSLQSAGRIGPAWSARTSSL